MFFHTVKPINKECFNCTFDVVVDFIMIFMLIFNNRLLLLHM
jgi:hypothetical protein